VGQRHREGPAGHHHNGGADGLLVAVDSPVHRMPPHGKLLAVVAFVLVVVSTPSAAWPALLGYAVLLATGFILARVPFAVAARRMLVETPFVVFALLLPFVATGPRVEVAGLSLSRAGLVGGAALLTKATLGVAAAVLLAATTAPRDLLAGLDRMHLPRALVSILSFMIRYASVVTGDLQRMRIARESRGYTGGSAGHLKAVAAGAGALFVRSYERGERVHLAMLARGYTGRMPALASKTFGAAAWVGCAVLPGGAVLVLAAERLLSSGLAG
jgi:cobalt/nickel transport system permease protein